MAFKSKTDGMIWTWRNSKRNASFLMKKVDHMIENLQKSLISSHRYSKESKKEIFTPTL